MTRANLLDALILIGIGGVTASVTLYAWQAAFGFVGVLLFTVGLIGRLRSVEQ